MARKDAAPHQVPQITDEARRRQAKLEAEILVYAERVRFIETHPDLFPCWVDLSKREAKSFNQGDQSG